MSGSTAPLDTSDQVEHDVVFEYMQEICNKYQATKEHLQRCLEQIRTLEHENAALQKTIAKLVANNGRQQQSPKRRKTQSPHHIVAAPSEANITRTSETLTDESHADEFNMAIQNVSTDGDGAADRQPEDNGNVADNTDDDEISATPVMQTYSIKRDRTKLASSNKPSSTSRPVKNEPHAASPSGDVINGSPLRDRNRATVARTSNNNRPKPATDASHGFVDVRTDARRPKDGVRKVLTLSSNRKRSPTTTTAAVQSPRVHQSVLDFKTSMSKDRKPLTVGLKTDPDETYCDEVLPDRTKKSLRQKTLDFSATVDRPADKLFNFAANPPVAVRVKPEPSTQQRQHRWSGEAGAAAERSAYDYGNSSSVFALPSDTDEIVMVDDTPPMLLEAAAAQPPLPVEPEPTVTVATVIRTAYRQPVSLRTGKEKAAQPGFMCPDCAPWFKYMGSRLSDRDIQKRLDACSRHRRDVRELPSTPEGFWVPYFEDTPPPPPEPMPAQQPRPDGEHRPPALVDYRLRNRQQVLDESMHY